MSAKVLSGKDAEQVLLVRWPKVDAPPTPGYAETATPRVKQITEAPGASPTELASFQAELERMKAEAERRVVEAEASGKRDGEAAARQALGANVSAEIEKIRQLSKELIACGPALRRQAEGDLARLGIAIARRILHREIQVDPDALLGLIKAALNKIDQREILTIRTHPESVELVQRVLEQGRTQKRIEITGDARLDRGALVIETSRGQLDASVETHLDEIERGFADLVGEQG
jgi:flagellar assembly protein FliH